MKESTHVLMTHEASCCNYILGSFNLSHTKINGCKVWSIKLFVKCEYVYVLTYNG